MSESLRQKIRKNLENSFVNKGFLFWILFPLFFIITLTIAFVSARRRARGYVNTKENFPRIICVGNVIIGGTGKSPVVQNIARYFLEKGFVVAIAARGVGNNIRNIYVSNQDNPQDSHLLSDENKEHYEILKYYFKQSHSEPLFYILQNKNRLSSLQYFTEELIKNNKNLAHAVFIMDDGLQRFSCPRHLNICLWSPTILLKSPNYPMPLGPYREGFGQNGFKKLLVDFDFRFWSRTSEKNLYHFKSDIYQALKRYNLSANDKDVIVAHKIIFWKAQSFARCAPLTMQLNSEDVINKIKDSHKIGIITGIANPEHFVSDISFFLRNKETDTLFLNDHAPLPDKAYTVLDNSDVLFFTLKDYLRWTADTTFLNTIAKKTVVICSVDVTFYDLELKKKNIF